MSFTFDNTAPEEKPIPYLREVAAKSTANVDLAAPPSLVDGVTFVGPIRGQAALLLASQTDPAENGVYELVAGAEVACIGSFAAAEYILTGLTVGKMYLCHALNASVVSVSNGVLTVEFSNPIDDGWIFIAAGGVGTLVFAGPSSGSATSLLDVFEAELELADIADEGDTDSVGNVVSIVNGTVGKGKRYQLTAISALGVRTYTLMTEQPSGLLLHWTRLAPTALTP